MDSVCLTRYLVLPVAQSDIFQPPEWLAPQRSHVNGNSQFDR